MWVALVGYGFGSFRRSITCDGLVFLCRIGVAAGPLAFKTGLKL